MTAYEKAVTARNLVSAIIFSALLAWVLSSCEQHELCYNHDHLSKLDVTYDWSLDEGASPGSMFLFLTPGDGSRTLRRDFAGCLHHRTEILVGMGYDVLGVNSDFEQDILQDTDNPGAMTVTTKDATRIEKLGVSVKALPTTRGNEGERFVMPTDGMWSDHSKEKVLLTHDMYYAGQDYALKLRPRPLYSNYTVIVRKIKNLQKVKTGIAASLSGLCGGRYLMSGDKTGENVTIPLAMLKEEDGSLTCHFKTFGRSKAGDIPNKLSFYTALKDGSKWSYVYDVTRQVKEAPDERNVTIVIDELTLPENIGDNSGITPDVSKWEVVDIPLKM